ncbi:MAG: M23 family metallopeptidase [Cyclobacteriaceae bacterium]|nr:M23 family metallopeptidase [Cyclobacteriaceae bacterium]
MAQKKYFYNPQTCSYEPVKIKKSDLFFGFSAFGIVVLLFAVILTILYNTYFDTEIEAQLKAENKGLKTHLVTIKKEQGEIDQMLEVLKQRDQQIYQMIYEDNSSNQKLSSQSIIAGLDDEINSSGYSNPLINDFKSKIEQINFNALSDLQELSKLAKNKLTDPQAINFIPTLQPIENPNLNALVSGFGKRMNPFHHGIMDHHGIDFTAPRGSEVFSTAQGTVKSVKITDANTGYGNRIEIDHGNGLLSHYAHLDNISVKVGQKVLKGEVIGTVGTSGGTIAPSIHYEIIRNGKKINPINFFIQNLSEKDYITLLELAHRENQSLD